MELWPCVWRMVPSIASEPRTLCWLQGELSNKNKVCSSLIAGGHLLVVGMEEPTSHAPQLTPVREMELP